jgi:hypothetical protein
MQKSVSCPNFRTPALMKQASVPLASLLMSGDVSQGASVPENVSAAACHLLTHEAGILPTVFKMASAHDMPIGLVAVCAFLLHMRTPASRVIEHASTDVDVVCMFAHAVLECGERADFEKLAMCIAFACVRAARGALSVG